VLLSSHGIHDTPPISPMRNEVRVTSVVARRLADRRPPDRSV